LNEKIFWLSIMILAVVGALLIWNPAKLGPIRPNLVAVLVGTALTLVVTFAFRLTAYAQCRDDGLWLQMPFYHLLLPYGDIKATRPTELARMFPPDKERGAQRFFLEGLWGRTVIIIELDKLPRRRLWLRLWMSKYMLCPEMPGLILAVRDWMAFRSELDEFRFRHLHG
jgi:hypothetical protein